MVTFKDDPCKFNNIIMFELYFFLCGWIVGEGNARKFPSLWPKPCKSHEFWWHMLAPIEGCTTSKANPHQTSSS